MKHRLSHKAERLDELAGLSALDRRELVEKWRSFYKIRGHRWEAKINF